MERVVKHLGLVDYEPTWRAMQALTDARTAGTADELWVLEHPAVYTLGLAGIDLEPGFGEPARHADDPIYFPVYEVCARLGVPVFLMSGPTTPNLAYNDPAALARVAQAFPQLPIVCYHGFYPNVSQIIGVAFRYENVFLVPDMYLFLPGSQLYVEAANGFMRDQLLFGSSYPFRPIRQSIDDFLQLGFKDEVLDKVLYRNARDLFRLPG